VLHKGGNNPQADGDGWLKRNQRKDAEEKERRGLIGFRGRESGKTGLKGGENVVSANRKKGRRRP